MARPGSESKPQFSQPVRQVFLMLIVIGLVGAGAFLALPQVMPVFEANPYLNGFIAFVFVIGLLTCFWQVVQLIGSIRWIERFAGGQMEPGKAPRLLASLATLLRELGSRMQITSSSSRSILDSVATRIDEVRDITRYIVNLLIFLGLLGTFYGLATTVPGVVDTIRGLAPQQGESSLEVFNRLMSGLETQLNGMGVAFASSLLGLAGSLVVGLLELFVGQSQNRFYRELEEWLSSITSVGFASDEGGEGGGSFVGVANHMAESVQVMQQIFVQSEAKRAEMDDKLERLTAAVDDLTETISRSGAGAGADTAGALMRIAQGQERLISRLETSGPGGEGIDAESRMRLRSIDVQMLRILEEISAGRQESMGELRLELQTLTRALMGDKVEFRRFRVRSTDPVPGAEE